MQSKLLAIALALGLVLFAGGSTLWAADCYCQNKTYTLDADFDEGTLVNVNHKAPNNDQLQLDSKATPFGFIWVAVSSEGTVVKIDTETGTILGKFRTTPSSQGSGNPSRTTVDNDGSVWVANRNDVSNGFGTVMHIGLLENGQCEDRNGNGVIDTSTGLGDVKAWIDASGTRGVDTADDECIVHYTEVKSRGTRHLSIDANNDVWVGGYSLRNFDLIKGGRYDVPGSGQIIRSETSVGFGGYGGLMDPNGVIWSANRLLRWDVVNPLTGPNGDPVGPSIGPPAAGTNWSGQTSPDSYGLCIDSQGNVWNTQLNGNVINKFAPDGTWLGGFAHGSENAQGCVVDGNDEVWVAHSLYAGKNTVGHLLNDGTYVGNVTLDPLVTAQPTGVAVDREGKIWATGYNSRKVYRIDPTLGPIGGGGVPVGAVDLATADLGGLLYNYSDMTGSTLIAPPNTGTWTVIYDSECPEHEWATVKVSWNSVEPGDSSIAVEVSSSDDGVTFGSPEVTTNGDPLTTVANGQFLKVVVAFERSTDTDDDGDGIYDSPILYDLMIECNQPPDCSQAEASIDTIWPPNHKFVDISVIGVTDPDGDPITITIDGISQDEPVDTYGDGSFTPDGQGVGTDTAQVRAERAGAKKVPGNGRVYHIAFTASDDKGGKCYGEVLVGVPHDQGQGNVPIDDGPSYDSTALSP
jgi:hypothetical protein